MAGLTRGETMPVPRTAAQVIEDLTDRIQRGEYPPGAQLPSYRQLNHLYSIGNTTAAKVYAILAERGLVVGVAGKGVYVAE